MPNGRKIIKLIGCYTNWDFFFSRVTLHRILCIYQEPFHLTLTQALCYFVNCIFIISVTWYWEMTGVMAERSWGGNMPPHDRLSYWWLIRELPYDCRNAALLDQLTEVLLPTTGDWLRGRSERVPTHVQKMWVINEPLKMAPSVRGLALRMSEPRRLCPTAFCFRPAVNGWGGEPWDQSPAGPTVLRGQKVPADIIF